MSVTEVIRRFPGPVVERWCTRGPASDAPRFQWVERIVGSTAGLLDARQMRILARHVPVTSVAHALVPSRSYDLTYWPHVPIQAVLFDMVFGGPLPGLPELEQALSAAGTFLAALHRVDLGDDLRTLPIRGLAPWREANPGLERRCDALRTELDDLLGPIAAQPVHGSVPEAIGLLHGRFSSAVMVPGSSLGIMAWSEAGLGDQLVDIAAMVAELLEAAAILPNRRAELVKGTSAFLAAYDAAGGRPWRQRRLPRLVADRILEHVCLRAVTVGSSKDAEALLARVGTTAARFLADVGLPVDDEELP